MKATLTFLFSLVLIFRSSAGTRTWTANGGNDLWSNTNNWSPKGFPGSADDLVFPGADSNNSMNNLAGLTVRSLTFSVGHNLGGNPIRVASGIFVDSGASLGSTNVTISADLTPTAMQTFQVSSGALSISGGINLNGQNLTFDVRTGSLLTANGVITGTGNLFKIFGGTLEIGGASGNTYSGFFTINRGLVRLNKQSGNAVCGPLTIGTILDSATVALLQSYQLRSSNSITINGNGVLDVDEQVQSLGPLTFNAGTTAITNIITRNGGTVFLRDVTITGGSAKIFGIVWVPFDSVFDCAQDSFLEIEGDLGGSGAIIKEGLGDLSLYGTNSFIGPVFINNGSLFAGGARPFGASSGGVTVSSSPTKQGILRLSTTVTNETLYLEGDYSPYVIFSSGGGWAGPIQLNTSTALLQSSGLTVLSGPITGTGDIDYLAYDFELTGNSDNSCSGDTWVKCRTLRLNKSGGARPFGGDLVIGGGFITNEVLWLNGLQALSNTVVHIETNGILNLNGFNQSLNGSLYMRGGRVETGTGTLSLSAGIVSLVNDTPAIINGKLSFSGDSLNPDSHTFAVADGPAVSDLEINAAISGSSFATLLKFGSGRLRLSGNNTFSGSFTIYEGMVAANHNNALGATSSGTTVNNGATLLLDVNASAVPEPLLLNGSGVGGSSGALNFSTGLLTENGNISLGSPSTIRVETSANGIAAGIISGTGPLTKIGSGTLQLGASSGSANTYSGDTFVNEGTVVLFKSSSAASIPGNLVIGSSFFFAPSAAVRHFQHFQIRSNVTVNATGLLDLNGFNEDLPALTLDSGGDVQTGSGLLTLSPGNSLIVTPGLGATAAISGRVALNAGNHTFNIASGALALGGPALNLSAALSQSGGTAAITKIGAGELRLGASNSFGGNLNVNAGLVTAANNFALGTTSGSTSINSNGAVGFDGNVVVGESFSVDSVATGALRSVNGSNTLTGTISLSRDADISVSPAGGILLVQNEIDDAGGIIKSGPGTLRFGGTVPNTYGGLTLVNNGIIEASRANFIGTTYISIPGDVLVTGDATNNFTGILRLLRPGQIARGASVTIESNAVFELATLILPATSATLRNLLGEGTVQLGGNTSLSVSNIVSFDFGGVLTGSGTLNKRGIASMVLLGDSPAYSGTMTVFDGRLRVQGSLPNSPVLVQGGSLRGDGRVGAVTVYQDGTVAPDSRFPAGLAGDLQMSSLTNLAGGLVDLEFYGTTPQGGNDLLLVNGPVDLAGGLSAGLKYAVHEGDVLTVIRKATPGPINGSFNGWTQGTTKLVNEVPVRINYAGGDGNDLTLTVTNLALESAGYVLASGNGNQQVEPDECNLLFAFLHNRRGVPVTITSAVLHSLTPGAIVTKAQAAYPLIAAGGIQSNATPFQLRTTSALACGAPVQVQLELTVPNEGTFAIPFLLIGGTNCTGNGGGCESCTVVAGQFTTNSPQTMQVPAPFGAPSACLPRKPCPGPLVFPDRVRYITHAFTNTSGADACITAQLHYDCASAPVGSLLVAAYADQFTAGDVCQGFVGDAGALLPDDPSPFSFTVTNGGRFEIVVMQLIDVPACPNYWVEVFGVPCPLPTLQITQDVIPGNVRLHWSTAYPDWRLQSVGSLDGPLPFPFQNVLNAVSILGGHYSVTDSATNSQRLYRLAK